MSIQVYKGDILLSQPELAKTQWEKAKGLMFSKQHDVLFHFSEEKRLHFHMVFVFYPIDIVFLDDEHRVVDLKPKFRPFTFYYSKAKSSTVIESYDGFINDHSISVGDELSIVHEGEINMASDTKPIPPALERKQVFHGTSLGKPRDAKVQPAEPSGIAPSASKRSASKSSQKSSTKKTSKSASKAKGSKSKKSSAKKSSSKSSSKSTKKSTRTTRKASSKKSSSASKKSSKKSSKTSSSKKASKKSTKKPSSKAASKSKGSKSKKSSAKKSSSKSSSKSSKKSTRTTRKASSKKSSSASKKSSKKSSKSKK